MQRLKLLAGNVSFISPRIQMLCKSSNLSNDLKDGMEITVKRKITLDDVEAFSKLTGDYNPVHTRIVHGALLNGLVSGVMGTKLPGPGTIVLSQEFDFPHPCYIDTVVDVCVSLVNIRKIVTCKFTCRRDDGKIVLKGVAKVILKRLSKC